MAPPEPTSVSCCFSCQAAPAGRAGAPRSGWHLEATALGLVIPAEGRGAGGSVRVTLVCAKLLSGCFSSGWGGIKASKGRREAIAVSGAFGAFCPPLVLKQEEKMLLELLETCPGGF